MMKNLMRQFVVSSVPFFMALLVSPWADACRFNVRDVGFVDFGQDHYILYGFVDSQTPSSAVETFDRVAFAALLESNIRYELILVDEVENHPGLEYYSKAKFPQLPTAVLVSPHGDAWPVTVEYGETDAYRERAWAAMEGLARSPLRERLLDLTLDAYGVVLIVEGENAALNRAAHQAADEALAAIERGMSALEKPIEKPPVKVTLTRVEAAAEQLLLWGLGITGDLDEPHAVVIYGRGRRMMDALQGERITSARLTNNLRLVGLNCECGLDRSVMVGQMFPLYWGSERRAQVVQKLGFDAESPIIKTEISQIIAIGQRNAHGAGVSTIEDMVLGYSEMSMQEAAALPIPGEPVGVAREALETQSEAMADAAFSAAEPYGLESNIQDGAGASVSMDGASGRSNIFPNWVFLAILVIGGAGALVLLAGLSILIFARGRNP